MILIRSNHDLQTSYLYYYTLPIIKFATSKGYDVILLENENISEINLRKRIKTRKPKFIFFNGHGSQEAIFDFKNSIFINLKSADVFNETITFARACDCLNKLGQEAINKGCLAFIGYKDKFFVARHHIQTCSPEADYVARPELECSNLVMVELLKGKTVKEAIESSHNDANKKIIELIYSKEPWAPASLYALVFNDQSLGFKGNPEAKF